MSLSIHQTGAFIMDKQIANQLYFTKNIKTPISCVHKISYDKHENFSMHLNAMCEIYIFVSGEADYIVESRCYPLTPYDVIIINPYEPHMPLVKHGCEYERYYFLLPLNIFSFMRNDPMQLLLHENRRGNNLIRLPAEKKEILKSNLNCFQNLWPDENVSLYTQACSSLLGILGLLNEHISCNNPVLLSSSDGIMPDLVADVLHYIQNNLSSDLNEAVLANIFHVSTAHLSRQFKDHVKIGLKKYTLFCRIGYAKRLLDSGRNVTEACFESGFTDCSYFIKVFKSYTGITPYKYQLARTQRKEI